MNEKDLGHGAKRGPNWSHKVERWLRPPVGNSEVPFDWNKGANSLASLTVPIKNQANSDSCGGQAASYAMAIAFALLSGTYTELSAKSIYSRIFYPDGGTTTGSVENIFKQDGATLESEVPSYINGLCTEAWMENIAWETLGLLQEATTRSGFTPLSVLLDIDSFAQAIRDYGFVIMMIDGQDGNPRGWLSPNPQPPVSANSSPLWSHFLCCFKASNESGQNGIYFLNSWGEEAGVNGIQYITQEYFNGGVVDAFTFQTPAPRPPASLAVDGNNTVPTPAELSFFQQTVKWITRCLSAMFGV